jgi:ubiquinone/menaquinone biosynthesis C-methylase UbiE
MEIKAKADHIVSELGRCQKENGGEWIGSIPEKYLDWIVAGKSVWAPQYTVHKTLMGLSDMYEFAGNEQALEILEKAAVWFERWTGRLSPEQMDRVLDVETGGMLEAWADLYGVTHRREHLELMQRYDRRHLFDRLVAGEDALSNMHANTTIPEALGAARAWEVTGEKRWRDIAEAYWRFAVTERGYYCTGGQTSGELWTEPFSFLPRLGDETQELCTVYNMIRLAEKLLSWTGDATYADYIERNLYNGILAQQNGETGMPAYHLPLKSGAAKRWGSPTNDFWCCHGTLLQSYSRNEGMIYYRDEEGIAVCQYFPSELNCNIEGTTLKLVQTNRDTFNKYAVTNLEADRTLFPDSLRFNIEVSCGEPRNFTLKFRLPGWISGEPVISVNGEKQEVSHNPSDFCCIYRTWKDDSINIESINDLIGLFENTSADHEENENHESDVFSKSDDDTIYFPKKHNEEQVEIIEKARKSFDKDFAKSSYMEQRIGDEQHLKQIIKSLSISKQSKILDLGTGNGYLAFPIAKANSDSEIVGLDIAVKTLAENKKKALEMGLANLHFIDYDGGNFPFADNTFDYVVTRYALHHFPNIAKTFKEIGRVIKSGGLLFIADPTPNEGDDSRFVDTYMQLKDDGHVKFYTKREFMELADKNNFIIKDIFTTEIRFPSDRTIKYLSLADNIDKRIIDSYDICIKNGQIFITAQVLNLLFIKQ